MTEMETSIEDFKKQIIEKIEAEISVNTKLIESKDRKLFKYLEYVNLGFKHAIEFIKNNGS